MAYQRSSSAQPMLHARTDRDYFRLVSVIQLYSRRRRALGVSSSTTSTERPRGSDMIDERAVTPLGALTSRPSLLAEGALVQLSLVFFVSPWRVDPFLVGPLVCLYALRESDRRAMMLYLVISAVGAVIDLGLIFAGGGLVKLASLVALALKAALALPAIRTHDGLPVARPERIDPAQMQIKVQEVVERVLIEELHRMHAARPPAPAQKASTTANALAQPSHLAVPGAVETAVIETAAAPASAHQPNSSSLPTSSWEEV